MIAMDNISVKINQSVKDFVFEKATSNLFKMKSVGKCSRIPLFLYVDCLMTVIKPFIRCQI